MQTKALEQLKTYYEELLGDDTVLYSLKEIEERKIMKQEFVKKLIYKSKIDHVRLGVKIFLTKKAIVDFLVSRTVLATK